MKKILHIILISLFSLTIFSCAKKSSTDDTTTATVSSIPLWAQEAYIKASNSENLDEFGSPVVLDGDTLAVGAAQEDSNQTTITNGTTSSSNNSNNNSGAVYVYSFK